MTITELRENRKKAWDAAKAFVETKRDKYGLLSDDDAKTYAEMEKKIRDYTAEIERVEQMDEIERNLSKPINAPIVTQPMQTKVKKTGRASDE